MKKVVSVSLGSSKRNHKVETTILGEEFSIERIGMDGDMNKAMAKMRELDGKVDAIGLGGTDLYLHAGGRRYSFRESKKFLTCLPNTPLVDGSYLKNTIERRVIYYVEEELGYQWAGRKVLQMAAVDRFGMAEALVSRKADVIFGDIMFALGLNIPIRSLKTLSRAFRIVAPIIMSMPISWIYPTGEAQEKTSDKYYSLFHDIEAITGDYLFIKKYMPPDMTGKVIITNTVTADDVEELRKRKAKMLITATPEMEGRSFGTNVMEAVLAALAGKAPADMTPQELDALLAKVDFKPRVVEF